MPSENLTQQKNCKSYTNDTNALIEMLHKIYPLLQERSIKNRLHRLSKKLKRETINNTSTNWTTDTESDASQKINIHPITSTL